MIALSKIARVSILAATVFTVAACTDPTPVKVVPGAAAVVATSHLVGTDISLSDGVRVNSLPRLDNATDEETVATTKSYLKRALNQEVAPLFKGKNKTRLSITLTNIQLASGAGRILGQTDSFMGGNVSIIDVSSGRVLKSTFINAKDEAVKGGGNIGILIAAAANAGTTVEKRYTALTNKFALEVAKWAKR